LEVDVTVLGGIEKLVTLPSSAEGTYEYVCTIPGHESITGTLVVQ